MKRMATAQWAGNFQEGRGKLTSQSRILNSTPYSFKTRFAEGVGTNPEELIAAAHAGCFTMAVDLLLSNKGFQPELLETQATVDLDVEALAISGIHLELKGDIKGITAEEFKAIAESAKDTCIISKALKVPITMTAFLIAN